jgi:methionine aminopeptidase
MTCIKTKLENQELKTNKILYEFITEYYNIHKINKAFPVGISVNNIIAHDSYHPNHIIHFKINDYIKVDLGLECEENIIDSARTFEYGISIESKPIKDCCQIVNLIEKYIQNELTINKKILIQKISTFTNIQILLAGYNVLDFLGGHNIEKGCVHGKKLILNKPLNLLPVESKKYVDITSELSEGEMFAIEVYIPNVISSGNMVQNVKIPVTHFEIDKEFKLNQLNVKERIEFQKIKNKTKNEPYEYHINDLFDKKIIKSLIYKQAIIKHLPLEWIDPNNDIKYVQYEDCYIINDNKLINITK